MVIDLTYACSMGCSHCMSDCKPDGEHMSLETLKDALEFYKKHGISHIILSGGELFEHPQIIECLELCAQYRGALIPLMLITNGRKLSSDLSLLGEFQKFVNKIGRKSVLIQVTDDPRFYPTSLDKKQRYRLEKLGASIEVVPGKLDHPDVCLYPQGRALENYPDSEWNTIAPKCVNCRLLVRQGITSFGNLVMTLSMRQKLCTPTISPSGDIKLGESRLCPPVASIYDPEDVIIEKINSFGCKKCEIPFEILKEHSRTGYDMLINI